MQKIILKKEDCERARKKISGGQTISQVADELNVSEIIVEYHSRGDCKHNTDVSPVTKTQPTQLPASECYNIRELADDGKSARDITKSTGRSFSTVVGHLTGECGHDDGTIFKRTEIFERIPVSPDDCRQFRREYDEREDISSIAEDVSWGYQTVRNHINGECDHDIEIKPRDSDSHKRIDSYLCENLRNRYRDNSTHTVESIAKEHDITSSAAEEHIKYTCSHPPSDYILELIEDVGLKSEIDVSDGEKQKEPEDMNTFSDQSGKKSGSDSASIDGNSNLDYEKRDTVKSSKDRPRMSIVGSLNKFTREEIEEFLNKLNWRVGESPKKEDRFILLGHESNNKLANENIHAPTIDEEKFITYFNWNVSSADDEEEPDTERRSNETDEKSNDNPNSPQLVLNDEKLSDLKKSIINNEEYQQGTGESYQISSTAKAALVKKMKHPDCNAKSESDLLSTIVRDRLKSWIDNPSPHIAEVPKTSVETFVDVDTRHEDMIDNICSNDNIYKNPGIFIDDAIRSQLDVSEVKPVDITISADTVEKMMAHVEYEQLDMAVERTINSIMKDIFE